jgi:hypothetical protein
MQHDDTLAYISKKSNGKTEYNIQPEGEFFKWMFSCLGFVHRYFCFDFFAMRVCIF